MKNPAARAGVVVCFVLNACASPEPPPASPGRESAIVAPRLPDTSEMDHDHDGVEDRILAATDRNADLLTVQIVQRKPTDPADLDAFTAAGGTVTYVFKAVSYGFVGKIAADRVAELPHVIPSLHVIALPPTIAPLGELETRAARARQAWPTTTGGTSTTIAIFDTGIDDTHTELTGRIVFWKDYTSDNHATPTDIDGHGTHVAGLALGTGASFPSGPTGTLRYSKSGSLQGLSQGSFGGALVYSPSAASVTASAVFDSTYGAKLRLFTVAPGSGSWQMQNENIGNSPLSSQAAAVAAGGKTIAMLEPTVWPDMQRYAITHQLANYPSVGDGYPTMSGVAPTTHWYAGKIFRDDLSPDGVCLAVAFDEMLQQHQALNVKVVNLSIGTDSPIISAAAGTVVDHGVVVVASAGNSGPAGGMLALALTPGVITVAATTAFNQVTAYTSVGPSGPTGSAIKPDLAAPGGSGAAPALSADSNDGDGFGFADAQANDYAPLQGTSMAAPIVSGAAALVVDAMMQNGHVWDWNTAYSALRVKNVLLATATETNTTREGTATNPPTLGRAATPKDRFEGYGMINVDAAIEAVTQPFVAPLSATVPVSTTPQWEKRAWARKITMRSGGGTQLTLTVPATGDFDLYVYAYDPDATGNPIILASSTNAALGAQESIDYTSPDAQDAIIVVKRVSGTGTFTLNGVVNNPPGAPGVEFLTSATLTSDAGNPSASVWGENVTFTYVAVGVTGPTAPTGTIELRTTGMLVPGGPATGGIVMSAALVVGGTGCTGQTLPCSSAVMTTPSLVVTGANNSLNHRIYGRYLGNAFYAAEPTTNLNGVNAKNHTVNARAASHVVHDWIDKPQSMSIYDDVYTDIATLVLACPAGRTCITPPPTSANNSGLQITEDLNPRFCNCSNVHIGADTLVLDSNWSITCRCTIGIALPVVTTGVYSGVNFVGDGLYYSSQFFPWNSTPSRMATATFVPVDMADMSVGGTTTPFGSEVSIRIRIGEGQAPPFDHISTFDLVDGPCNASPPSPVLQSYVNETGYERTFKTSSLPQGAHDLHVCHWGGLTPTYRDVGRGPGAVYFITHTVSGGSPAQATTTTITGTPATGTYGFPSTFTAGVTSASGAVSVGNTSINVGNVFQASGAMGASGTASVIAPLLPVGSYTVTAQYYAGAGYLSSSATTPYQVDKAVAALDVAITPSGVVATGREVVLTARVGRMAGASVTALLPSGSVSFMEGANPLCTNVPLVELETAAATAECTIPAPSPGSHTITATYYPSGDPRYVAPAPLDVVFEVEHLTAIVSFTQAPASSVFGESKTWAVSVAESNGNTYIVPGGTVTFSAGATTLCSAVTLMGGNASCTAAAPSAGDGQTITAAYSGDSSFQAAQGTASHDVAKAAIETSVVSSGSPTPAGDTVAFEAQLTVTAPGAGAPTGVVDFIFDDGATGITGSTGRTVDGSGKATFSTAALAAGTHTVRAHYTGSSNFAASQLADEDEITQEILAVSTGITVMKTPAGDSTYGETVELLAAVGSTGPVATGHAQFVVDGGTPVSIQLDANGRAVFSTASLATGAHTIVVTYAGDPMHAAAPDVTVNHTVTKVASTTALASSQDPQLQGSNITFTATVTLASGSGVATGSVIFKDGTTTIGGPIALTGGSASFTTNALVVGVHNLTAEYSGDSNVLASSDAYDQTIETDPSSVSLVTVTASPQQASYGDSVTLNVTVTDAVLAPLTGDVVLTLDGESFAPVTLNPDGTAAIELSPLLAELLASGSHTVAIAYLGSGPAPAANGGINFSVAKATTTTTVMTSSATTVFGEEVTVTVHVASPATAGGSVTFYDGATIVGVVALDASGNAALTTTTLGAGGHTLRAEYSGDANHDASTSADVSNTVNKAATTVSLITATNPVAPGADIVLTATVSVVAPGAGTRTGQVTFKDGATVLGTASVGSDGTATFTLSGGRALGSYTFTVEYDGDASFAASTSSVLALQVGFDTTLSLAASAPSVLYLDSATLTATLSESAATGSVTFAQGGTTLGSAVIVDGVATLAWDATLVPGTYAFSAVYGGDATYNAGAEASVMLTIAERTPTVTLSQSSETSVEGEPVTITGTIVLGATPPSPLALALTYFDGATALSAAVPVQGGSASFTTTTLAVGTHTLTAKLEAMPGFAAATSVVLLHEVTASEGTGNANGSIGGEDETGGADETGGVKKGCGCGSTSEGVLPLFFVAVVLLRRRARRS